MLARRANQLAARLNGLPDDRQQAVVSAWIDAARALQPDLMMEALEALASYLGPNRAQSCISALTELCADGNQEACSRVSRMLAALSTTSGTGIPRSLLEADFAAATRANDAAQRYLDLIAGELRVRVANPADLVKTLGNVESDARLRGNPLALASLNNLADFLRRSGDSSGVPTALARLVVAAIPDSPDAVDTLFRCALLASDLTTARESATRQTDPLLSAIENSELAVQQRDPARLRDALQRVDFQMSRMGILRWSLLQRVEAVRASLRALETGNGGVL